MVESKEILFYDMNLVWELYWPVWLTSQSIPRLTWSSFGGNLWGVTSEVRSSSVVPEASNRRDSISCLDNCNKPQNILFIILWSTVINVKISLGFFINQYLTDMFHIQSIWMMNINDVYRLLPVTSCNWRPELFSGMLTHAFCNEKKNKLNYFTYISRRLKNIYLYKDRYNYIYTHVL